MNEKLVAANDAKASEPPKQEDELKPPEKPILGYFDIRGQA